VDPATWLCLDPYVCAGKLEMRRKHSRLWQMLQAVKSHSAIVRRARRLQVEDQLAQIDPTQDARVDQLTEQMFQLEQAKKAKARNPRPKPKPKTGSCECCGEPTRGGRFLPGHDAKLASALKGRVVSGDSKAFEEMKRRNWLNKLPAKYRDGV
jgi:hypothetical protein